MYDGDTFFHKIKRTVYKWWCVIYKPVYKLTHQKYWAKKGCTENTHEEAEASAQYASNTNFQNASQDMEAARLLAEQMANRIERENQYHIDELVNTTEELFTVPEPATPDDSPAQNTDASYSASDTDTPNVDADVLARANEIMERLAREAAEDEAKKQSEIEAAKRKAEEDERLASILKSTQIDISQYIEEGKASQQK